MDDDFSSRAAALYSVSFNFLSNYHIYLISGAIAVGTVFFTILINHGVRLRRIKLIHGFTSTFNPEKQRRPIEKAHKSHETETSATRSSEKRGSRLSRRDTDIRYSPSLEFVVAKYITDLDEILQPSQFMRLREFVRSDDANIRLAPEALDKNPEEHPLEYMLHGIGCFGLPVNRRMLFNAIPTIAVIAVGWYLVLQALRVIAHHYWVHPIDIVPAQDAEAPKACFSHLIPLAIVFFSAYVASVKMLVRAVSLFDLTAITFLRVFLHIVGSMLAGYVIWAWFIWAWGSGDLTCDSEPRYFLYPVFFVLGFIPDGGINTLLSHISTAAQQPKSKKGWKAKFYGFFSTITQFVKQTDGRFAGITKSTPLEVIDGIDFFTRYRLEEAGIYEVQNLATANPILLHVETPFGIYQVIDWVGQAQLCTVVGLERFLIFRQLNVRTVFDLERAVLSLKATSQIRRIIGGILLMPTNVLADIDQLSDVGGRFPDLSDASGKAAAPAEAAVPPAPAAAAADGNVEKQEDAAKDAPTQPDRPPPPQPGYLTAQQYCRWSTAEALKPASYRLILPERCDEGGEVDCGASYRVFPIKAPANLSEYAKFELVEGCKREVLTIHEVNGDQDATIKHAVRLIMDDLHVMRLRQIWESIARILGPDAATLDDSEDTFLGA